MRGTALRLEVFSMTTWLITRFRINKNNSARDRRQVIMNLQLIHNSYRLYLVK